MKQSKLYRVIAKVENEKFIKHHVNNLLSYVNYLDQNFPDWRWFNVYDKKSEKQVANYTNRNRPQYKTIKA